MGYTIDGKKYTDKDLIMNLINPGVEKDYTDQTLRNLATLFAGQRNELTDIGARTNIGADAQAAMIRGSYVNQAGAESNALVNLQKMFQDQKFKQMQLWLQNKGLNIQKEQGETDWMDVLASTLGSAAESGGYAAGMKYL